jgi:peptidoglycan-N-acetylglucosamine deacetylase
MLRLLAFYSLAAFVSISSAQGPAKPASPAPATPPANATAPVPAVIATPAAPAAPATPAPTAAEPVAKPAPINPAKVTVTRCNVEGPFIAITFDDGPHGVQTPRLLKMLRERGIRATFFVVGSCVAENPEIAKQIVKEGHEIANHSWSHPNLGKMGTDNVRDQIERTHNVVRQETEVAPTILRPPYGSFTNQQRAWAYATWGYQTILWDVDSLDWKHRSPAKTESIIMAGTKPGSIILCHDIHKTTIDAMPSTLDKLIAKGFKFATVSELLKMHREPAVPVKAAAAQPLSAKEAATAVTSLEELRKPAAKVQPVKR